MMSSITCYRSLSSEVGGADRDRTDDLRLAKPALSQLSYSPEDCACRTRACRGLILVPRSKLTPSTAERPPCSRQPQQSEALAHSWVGAPTRKTITWARA